MHYDISPVRFGPVAASPPRDAAGELADLRPFYFINVLWGQRFRDYFLELCLPSWLAPGNLPALRRRGKDKFLIATRPEDWDAMTRTAIWRVLESYVEPVFIEIPPCPPDRSGCEHMGIGHRIATEMCFRDKVYGVPMTPDLVVSDGAVDALIRHARARKRLVLTAALRFGEEPLFARMQELGFVSAAERRSVTGSPLVMSGRDMVQAGLNAFHSETARYEWDGPCFADFPVACIWRVPGQQGCVIHCLSWAVVLLDYAAMKTHDTTALETWTMDGDYVYRNLGDTPEVHVVQDSDEMMLLSWAPLNDRPHDLRPILSRGQSMTGEINKGALLRSAYNSAVYDPLKRNIFFLPVLWHAGDLQDAAWRAVERRAFVRLALWVTPPNRDYLRLALARLASGHAPETPLARLQAHLSHGNTLALRAGLGIAIGFVRTSASAVGTSRRIYWVLADLWRARRFIGARLSQAIRGDAESWRRMARTAGQIVAQLLGRKTV